MNIASKLSTAFPTACRVCRQWGSGMLCGTCEHRFSVSCMRCARCGLSLGAQELRASSAEQVGLALTGHDMTCANCVKQPPLWRLAVCAVDYAYPWSKLLADFKFRGEVSMAGMLADRLAAALKHSSPGCDVELVMPVPLSEKRLQERGFNQSWELARRLARVMTVAVEPDLLQRPVDTSHQVELSMRQRALNLRGAFMVPQQRWHTVAGRRVAIVDDVMTTGATFTEATRTLLRAGASSVDVWAVARTPL